MPCYYIDEAALEALRKSMMGQEVKTLAALLQKSRQGLPLTQAERQRIGKAAGDLLLDALKEGRISKAEYFRKKKGLDECIAVRAPAGRVIA